MSDLFSEGDVEGVIKVVAVAVMALGVTVLLVPFAFYEAWSIHALWGWFAVPLGMPTITLRQAWGVAILVGALTKQFIPSDDDKKGELLAFLIIGPVFSYVVGYAVSHWWM